MKAPVSIAEASVLTIAGFVLGLIFGNVAPAVRVHLSCEEEYPLLNGHFVCGEATGIDKRGYAETEAKIEAQLSQEYNKKTLLEAGVYFRDLYFGPIFSVNAEADFAPASLLKVPLAMTFLKLSETAPNLLKEEIVFTSSGEDDVATAHSQHFSPPVTLERNKSYTLEELLMHMVKYSDNHAYDLLYTYLNLRAPEEFVRTYRELGIIRPESDLDETITVKDFGTILRILYTATYLTPENSQKILRWLSEYQLTEGLVAGVPPGIPVASKFGERAVLPDGIKQFHNCGIIYYPRNPYLLCVMTKGKEWQDLTRVVETISRMVYEEINARQQR